MTDVSSSIQVTEHGIKVRVPKPEVAPAPLPDGFYDVVVARCEHRTSKNGNPMLTFALEVVDGDHSGEWVWENVVLTEKALFRLFIVLEALTGQPCNQEELDLVPDEFVGLRCSVDVTSSEYQGKFYNNVVSWYPATSASSSPGPADEDDLPF